MEGNLFAYCCNSPIVHHDQNGYTTVSSLAEFEYFLYDEAYRLGPKLSAFLQTVRGVTGREERGEKRIPYRLGGFSLDGMDCSGLINYALGRKADEGASTLAREHAAIGGFIQDMGWENIPSGAILGKLTYLNGTRYLGDTFSFSLINKYGKNYKISHVGVFDHYDKLNDAVCIHQSTSSAKYNGAVNTSFTSKKKEKLGWNIWFIPGQLLDNDYTVIDDWE